ARDPWRIALSTDHPNGGSFLSYPRIIRWLMDRGSRTETLATIHPKVRRRSQLAQLDREYTLREICIITRAAPARLLGLPTKGHLGPGADADVTIYTPSADFQQMFEMPRHVIKARQVIVENGESRAQPLGKTLHVATEYDRAIEPHLAEWFNQHYSLRFSNYAVNDSYLADNEIVSCR
ncbi:MAG TPA: amidohydrolase family protein, partial [Pirellulales bacterium]